MTVITMIMTVQDQFGAGLCNNRPEAAGVGQAAREAEAVQHFRRVMDQHNAGEALSADCLQQTTQLLRLVRSKPARRHEWRAGNR